MGRKVIMKETLAIQEAFEYYYQLGENRSLAQVAEHVGKALTTLTNWSASFNWQQRLIQRDIEVAQQMQVKNIKEIATTKANYRKVLSALVKKFVDNLKENKVDMTKISDLERVMKLDLLLMGELTENVGNTTTHTLEASDKALIDKVCTSLERMYGDIDDGDIIEPKADGLDDEEEVPVIAESGEVESE